MNPFIIKILMILSFTTYLIGDNMIEQNSTIEPFTLNDQFGNEHNLSTLPKLLICSFGKESGTLISNYFNRQESNYLSQYDIVLIADVSGVPSLLRKTIIVPKMKKNSFSILLSTESNFMKEFPKKEDSLTILKLDNGVVKETVFVADEVGLKESIEG